MSVYDVGLQGGACRPGGCAAHGVFFFFFFAPTGREGDIEQKKKTVFLLRRDGRTEVQMITARPTSSPAFSRFVYLSGIYQISGIMFFQPSFKTLSAAYFALKVNQDGFSFFFFS